MYESILCARTDGGENAGEAEVVHGVQAQEMEKKLFLLFFTAQEGVSLIQLPVDMLHTYYTLHPQ